MDITGYRSMAKQVQALIEEDPWYVAVLSNTAALIWDQLKDINWAGFYIVRDGRLVLGPFQGKVACIHIEKSRGVCGAAWREDCTQLVEDVHQFPGHIACDSASNSEVVVPIHKDGDVVAVIDIDSPLKGRFGADDARGLEEIAAVLGSGVLWE